jgi:hypothetical protein
MVTVCNTFFSRQAAAGRAFKNSRLFIRTDNTKAAAFGAFYLYIRRNSTMRAIGTVWLINHPFHIYPPVRLTSTYIKQKNFLQS